MPLYEYLCHKCHQQVEILIRNSSDLPACPNCGSTQLDRQLSVAAPPATGSSKSLPVSSQGGCGRSECASGRCMFE